MPTTLKTLERKKKVIEEGFNKLTADEQVLNERLRNLAHGQYSKAKFGGLTYTKYQRKGRTNWEKIICELCEQTDLKVPPSLIEKHTKQPISSERITFSEKEYDALLSA